MSYEYKVVPAPKRGLKAKGVKSSEDRFANALQTVMNEMGQKGWEYQRTDTLPSEEREGLIGRSTVYQNMLVFRRALNAVRPGVAPAAAPAVKAPVAPSAPLKTGAERIAAKARPPQGHVPLDPETGRREPKLAAE